MKTPLLWVVIVFALGEALCRLSITMVGIMVLAAGTAFLVMQICSRDTNRFVSRLLFFSFLAGIFLGLNAKWTQDRAISSNAISVGKKISFSGAVLSVTDQESNIRILMRSNGVKVLVYVDGESANVRYGDTGYTDGSAASNIYPGQEIEVIGTIKQFEENANPGQFNAKLYYENQGIYYQMNADTVTVLEESYDGIKVLLLRLSHALSESIDSLLDEREASVLKSMILGEKSEMDAEVKTLYQVNGIAHILAISGLHVAMIGAFLAWILKKTGIGIRKAEVLSIGFLLLYGMMTGFASSTIRAIIMLIISWSSGWVKRSSYTVTSMATALFIMLLIEPRGIYQVGFQMSFLAVLGVEAGNSMCRKYLDKSLWKGWKPKTKKFVKGILKSILVSFSINLFMIPVQIYHYYEIPLYSMLLNLLILPLFSWAVASGFLGAFFGLILPYVSGGLYTVLLIVGKCLVLPCSLILKFYEWMCRCFLHLPFHRINPGHCSFVFLIVYYMLLLVVFWMMLRSPRGKKEKRERVAILAYAVAGILLLFVFLSATNYLNKKDFRVVFLSVGQGDGCIIHTPQGLNIMVDGGATGKSSVGKNILSPALKYYGMSEIDYAFISHTDSDHVNGILYLLENSELLGTRIENLVFSEGLERDEKYLFLEQAAEKSGTRILYVFRGDMLHNDNLEIEILNPQKSVKQGDINDNSLVMNVRYRNLNILFTGDISSDVEKKLLPDIERIHASVSGYMVLKVAHHGSKYSSGSEFLDALAGDMAVISCGKYNTYGHPAKETLERLEESGYEIYRTDETGAVILEF